MTRKEEGSFVALTKCYFCMGSNYILMHKRMGDVSEYDGKVIDMTPCEKCKDYMDQGIILITIDSAKSEDGWEKNKIPNPYRTGGWFVVTEKGFEHMINNDESTLLEFGLKHRWMFVEHELAETVGLFDLEQTE